jgi:dienelactone hydrolase
VLPGVEAEGLHLLPPGGKCSAKVVAVPTAGEYPDEIAGTGGSDDFALRLAMNGCEVLVPITISRSSTYSGNPDIGRATNIPHREFVHRMAYEMGRTLVGYEVQKVLAAADWYCRHGKPDVPVGVVGKGDGGRVALYAAALDERFDVCAVSGAYRWQASAWERPLDYNLFGLLNGYGDAEIGSLIAPRKLIVDPRFGPQWAGPDPAAPGRSGAAPGVLIPSPFNEDIPYEVARLRSMIGDKLSVTSEKQLDATDAFLNSVGVTRPVRRPVPAFRVFTSAPGEPFRTVHRRQFDQLLNHVQALYRDSDRVRKAYWSKTDASSPEAWEKSCEPYRTDFHERIIGQMPPPTLPPNPRTCQVYDEPTWAGYEVKLDIHPEVFASGIVLIPKDLKPAQKRPAVVCQHGLEGNPRSCIDPEARPTYNQFARKLVEKGYIVYCPQNPYIGGNAFRQVQRKANLVGRSLFSVIIQQHAVTLDWLQKLPGVDPDRIGFYGLSYGGKTAMRVPAVEKRYKVSICSGDFIEWIGKVVRTDLPMSYMFTGEYEMYEFDLGNTFNYAEMAHLIAPRPFMVERGHDDGVGTDEMVSSEFAKVRYLYANRLKLPDRAAIEYNVGGHEIFARGTFEFLERHLGPPNP